MLKVDAENDLDEGESNDEGEAEKDEAETTPGLRRGRRWAGPSPGKIVRARRSTRGELEIFFLF